VGGTKRMRNRLAARASTTVACMGIIAAFMAVTSAGALVEDALPSSYVIDEVPLYQQIDAKGCGAVALQMVFDYYGPFIDQREIYDAARSGGTTLPDMARAAQFSRMSTAVGDRFPGFQVTGYTARDIGYAGFYYASTEPWLEELKSIVAQGYPVIVLVEWMVDYEGGDHYRVVIGYDDDRGVLLMRDGWVREFKDDQEYEGSTSQLASDLAKDTEYAPYEMTYDDFMETWSELDTDLWGVEGKFYGAVLVTPWEVEISVPNKIGVGDEFTVTAVAKYPCLAPFGDDEFPVFTAEGTELAITLGDGLELVGCDSVANVGELEAGGSIEISWTVEATEKGDTSVDVLATGLVSGSLNVWKDWPAYDYEDLIGGSGTVDLMVSG
jgi:hypothetical protein